MGTKQRNAGSLRKAILALILAAVMIASSALLLYAALRDTTARVEDLFLPAQVSCKVKETFNGNTKSDVYVTNTGNVPAYIRVKVIVNWLDKDGNVAMYVPDDYDYVVDNHLSAATKNKPATTKWTAQTAGQTLTGGYWYYNGVVQPGKDTEKLIGSIIPEQPIGSPYSMQVQILAEAMQASENQTEKIVSPATSAPKGVEEKWEMKYNGTKWEKVVAP